MKGLVTLLTVALCATSNLGHAQSKPAQSKPAGKINVEIISDGTLKEFKLDDHKDKVVVLEFWATWCPPCRKSIPHLGKLQKKYGEKVVILGVSNETKSKVQEFYKKMKKVMTYTVALDKTGTTNKAYMKAYGVRGIPHAFIIKGGKVIWNGHPGRIDAPLAKAVGGGQVGEKKFMDLELNMK